MWYRNDLKKRAKAILSKHYWKAVLVALILAMISGGGSGAGGGSSYNGSSYNNSSTSTDSTGNFLDFFRDFSLDAETKAVMTGVIAVTIGIVLIIVILSIALSLFVFNPLRVGAQKFFISCQEEAPPLNVLTFCFSNSYGNVVKIMFLQGLYTFLWSLLFIIPGIIKAYEYRMIPYILAENPDMDKDAVFARTKAMMTGEKWRTFVLDLSFFGWYFLGGLTCCILSVFFVNPYCYLTCAQLYLVLKQKVDAQTPVSQTPVSETPVVEEISQNPYL